MARVRKPQPTLENLMFSNPEQKVLRFLLSEPTSSFTPRVISSRLKGVRGLGGTEGIVRILTELETLGLVDFVDNRRAARLRDEGTVVQSLKTFAALCDLEGLKKMLEPLSKRGILFGSRAAGMARSDSDYNLLIVSEQPSEVEEIARRHPLGKLLQVNALKDADYAAIPKGNPNLHQSSVRGIVLW